MWARVFSASNGWRLWYELGLHESFGYVQFRMCISLKTGYNKASRSLQLRALVCKSRYQIAVVHLKREHLSVNI